MQIIDPKTFSIERVEIPQNATQDEWAKLHKAILLCKRASSRWLKQSRDFATQQWGIEFVAETEVQIEMDLGLTLPPEQATINAKDKSTAFVTMEGISMRYELWFRKVADDIPKWDQSQIKRALELMEPIERKAQELRNMLSR